ncbi:MAG: AAA family ATPase [Chloroflexota bacterium]
MNCPTCHFDNPDRNRFCGMCGAAISQLCAHCNTWNPLTYRFCGMCGTPLSGANPTAEALQRPAESEARPLRQLEGERRLSTVLMADVFNSTGILEQVGSEAWVAIMSQVLQVMEREVQRFGGVVDQFRGDGLVAFFGSQQAHEDDPERGVLAALGIQQAIKEHAAQVETEHGLAISVRVGVNTGELIRTSVGEGPQRQLDTGMGEAITIAARLEASAEPGTSLVSHNTYRLVENRFKWLPLGAISIKGLSYPIEVYRPLSHQSSEATEAVGITQILPGPLHRAVEAEALFERIHKLSHGQGGIILLSGEKGMGKAFLLRYVREYFTNTASEQHPLTWLTGYCRSYEQSQPYSMWINLLERWIQIETDEALEARRQRLRHKLERIDSIVWTYPYLATLLSLPLEDEYSEWLRNMSVEELKKLIFRAVQGWVEALAQNEPVLLAFAYIQWADDTSLDLLKTCLPFCKRLPLLFLFTYHSGLDPALEKFRHELQHSYPQQLSALELQPFDAAQSQALIDALIGVDVLSENALALVVQQAEGNPYYIKELLHQMMEEGILQRDDQGLWRETRPVSSLDLPNSLQGLLLTRIDRLSPTERQVIQAAAVVGTVFWHEVLNKLFERPDLVNATLEQLLEKQLIHIRHQSHDLGIEYAFSPSLIRDVLYDSLLSSQRVQLHLQVADAIASCLPAETLRRYDSLVAYHYRNAHQHQKELFFILLAAEQARKIYANHEAIQHYTRALEILAEIEAEQKNRTDNEAPGYILLTQRFEVLNGRRQVLYTLGDIQTGRRDARALLPLADMLSDDPSWKIDALLAQPEVTDWDNREELADGLNMAEEALALSQQIGDQQREMICLLAVAEKHRLLKQNDWLALSLRALEIARSLEDCSQEVNILLSIGKAYGPDHRSEALQYLQQAFTVSQKVEDSAIQSDILQLLAFELERQGDYYRQLSECEEKRLEIARKTGKRRTEGHALMKCGQIRAIYLGDYPGGSELVAMAIETWQHTTARVFPLLRLAQICVQQKLFDKAQSLLDEAALYQDRVAEDTGRAGLALVRASLYNLIGGESALASAIHEAGRIWQMSVEHLVSRQYQIAAGCILTDTHLRLAELCSDPANAREHHNQALLLSRTALEIYWEFGFVQVIECTSEEVLYRYSMALAANGRSKEANAFLQQAYTEMMRKHALIPSHTPYFRTYLNTPLHQEIESRAQKTDTNA